MANGIFTTKPFNLGNTLSQVAQIQNFQSTNKLREAQLGELDRQNQQRNQLNAFLQQPGFDITDPANLNKLAQFGSEGLALAGDVTDLRTDIANLDVAQRENVISKAQFLNRKSRSIVESEDIKQRFGFEMQGDEFAEIVNRIRPGLNLDDVSDEQLRQALQQVIGETDFANDPVAVTELLSGVALEEKFGLAPGSIEPGTVAELTTDPLTGQPTDVSLLQSPGTPLVNIDARDRLLPSSGFRFIDPTDPGLGEEPIPGGPADTLAVEAAAKVQQLEDGIRDIKEFKTFIFDEDGSVNRVNVANMNIGTPFTKGRTANILLLNAIEAKLRAESGAAVPETEVKRAGKRFRPRLIDLDETIEVKIRMLESFLQGAFDKVQRDGRFDVAGTVDAFLAAGDEAGVPQAPELTEDEKRLQKLGLLPE